MKRQLAAVEVIQNMFSEKKLIFSMAKNDFRMRFAGSSFGVLWAFVQPVITVFVYWFVFEKALNIGSQGTKAGIEVPYILWMIAGIIPWFYFSDVINSGTNVLIEYSYLVKKVLFNITLLPIVKIVSGTFVHVFFVIFMFVMYMLYGYFPNIYMLQVVYYSFALMVLTLGIIYMTGAVAAAFRDLKELVSIALQIGIWATPIMWNIDGMTLPQPLMIILKLNPLYYIVAGYRDAMYGKTWFWEHPYLTVWYWSVTIVIFIFGTYVFRTVKQIFADVL